MKMSEALAKIFDFMLFVAAIEGDESDIFAHYGIRKRFSIIVRKPGSLWPRSFFAAVYYRDDIRSAPPGTIFYVREPLLAFMLIIISKHFRNSFFIEIHSFTRYPKIVYSIIFKKALGIITTTQIKKEVLKN